MGRKREIESPGDNDEVTATAVVTINDDLPDYGEALKQVITGNIATLSSEQQAQYILGVCQSLGFNPATSPIAIMTLKGGKTILYVKKDGTDQLRKLHRVSVEIVGRELLDGDLYVVTARATLPSGRCDESIGAVNLKGLSGEDRANALMRTETKSKRRVTLSICGLGFIDEIETDALPQVTQVNGQQKPRQVAGEIVEHPAALKPAITLAQIEAMAAPLANILDASLGCTSEQVDAIDVLRDKLGYTEEALGKSLVKKYFVTDPKLLSNIHAEEVIKTLDRLLVEKQRKDAEARLAAVPRTPSTSRK